jgi:hypothetical protein
VKDGGTLVYSSRDEDPFQTVMEWWNQNGNRYGAPSAHLFSLMGIPEKAREGIYKYGKGAVMVARKDPKEYVLSEGADQNFVREVSALYKQAAKGRDLEFKNVFCLQRGMYDLVAVMNESITEEPYRIEGTLIDLFDPELPVCTSKEIRPGEQGYFINLDRVKKGKPHVLASGSRESDEVIASHSYTYLAKGPQRTTAVSRVWLPSRPTAVKVNGTDVLDEAAWNAPSQTYLLKYENDPDGVRVEFVW